MSASRVLLAGGTGYLGGFLLGELKERGHWVRALVRRPEQAAAVAVADDVFVGRVTEPATLRGAAEGVELVCSTVGITRQRDGLGYEQVDLARACLAAAGDGADEVAVGGPDVLSHEEIARTAFAALGGRPRVRHLPAGLATGASRLLRGVTPQRIYGPAEFLVAAMTHDMVAPESGSERLADHFAGLAAG